MATWPTTTPVKAGGLVPSWLDCLGEAVSRVRSHISPGPYRSFRELSLAGSVDPVIWCPPTFVGNSGIECFNGHRGFALFLFFCRRDIPQVSFADRAIEGRTPHRSAGETRRIDRQEACRRG